MKKGHCKQIEFGLNNTKVKTVEQKQLVEQLQILVKTYSNPIES